MQDTVADAQPRTVTPEYHPRCAYPGCSDRRHLTPLPEGDAAFFLNSQYTHVGRCERSHARYLRGIYGKDIGAERVIIEYRDKSNAGV